MTCLTLESLRVHKQVADEPLTPEDAWNAALEAASYYFLGTRQLEDGDLTFQTELELMKV